VRRIAITHIPRTGGTSLSVELARNGILSGKASRKYHADESCAGRREFLRKQRIKKNIRGADPSLFWSFSDLSRALDSGCVIGHISANDFFRAGAEHVHITVREPRSRLLSLFLFWAAQSDEWHRGYGPNGNSNRKGLARNLSAWLEAYQNEGRQIKKMGHVHAAFLARGVKVSYHWPSDLLRLGAALTGDENFVLPVTNQSNALPGLSIERDDRLIHEVTQTDSAFLRQLMDRGLLSPRTSESLDHEYETMIESLSA